MHRSVPYLARFRDLLGRFGRKGESSKLAGEEISENQEIDEEAEAASDMDVLKARGVLKYIHSYEPPSDLDQQLAEIVRRNLPSPPQSIAHQDSIKNLSFSDHGIDFKFKVLSEAEEKFGKRIPNIHLHELKTLTDLVEFYRIPVKNVTSYTEMARAKDRLPANLHIAEEPNQFHPMTDGETAYPGRSRYVTDLRERQFDKGFRAKKEWHEYQEKHFDYDKAPPNCPWDKKKADRYDVINFRLRPEFPG